jgi:hypothetical protein
MPTMGRRAIMHRALLVRHLWGYVTPMTGMDVEQSEDRTSISVSSVTAITAFLKKYGLWDCVMHKTPTTKALTMAMTSENCPSALTERKAQGNAEAAEQLLAYKWVLWIHCQHDPHIHVICSEAGC